MPPPATPSADVPAAGTVPASTWGTLGRHQLGAVAATLIDFGCMIFGVQVLGLPPTAATAIGSGFGGITNFLLGRTWIFRQHSGDVTGQALRYALVSGASAGWNALGEHIVHDREHVQYVAARALVSLAVSLLWNFPMQRWFVFREGQSP